MLQVYRSVGNRRKSFEVEGDGKDDDDVATDSRSRSEGRTRESARLRGRELT